MSKKKSEFIGVGSVPSSYQFNCFVAGVDRRIPKEDLFQQIKDESFAPFIYPTIELLQNADLEADDTNPTYVRCEETEYRLYKITNLAAGVDDITLDNGNTATYQVEYRDTGFVTSVATAATGAIAVFTDSSGQELDKSVVPTNAGKAFMQAADSASVTYARKNADNTVTMRTSSQHFDDIKQVSAVGYSGTIETASDASTLLQVATDEAVTPSNLAALKASSAEVLAGTNTVKYVTSETLQDKLVDQSILTVDTFADLATTPAAAGQVVYVEGYSDQGILSGHYIASSGSADPTDPEQIDSGTPGVYFSLAPSDYFRKTFSSSSLARPHRIYSADQIKSLGDVTPSFVRLNTNASLTSVEVIAPITEGTDVEVWVDMDTTAVPNNAGTDVHVVAVQCTDLNRTSTSNRAVTVTQVTPTSWKFVATTASLSRPFLAFSVRIAAAAAQQVTIRSIKLYQGVTLVGKSFFDMFPNRSVWGSNSRSAVITGHVSQFLSIGDAGEFYGYNGVTLHPAGRSDMLGDSLSLDFFTGTVHPILTGLANIRLIAGDYYGYRLSSLLTLRADTNLIAIGGKARLMCGREMSTTNWVAEQTSPRYVFSCSYDWVNNQDADIRAGTKQPFVSQVVPANSTKSLIAYQFTPVASEAAVLANDYSVWYDHANKILYFSFDSANENTYVYVAEADTGIIMGNTAYNLNAYNVDIVAGKGDLWRLRPTTYTARRNGGKFVSLHDCGSYGSNNENGIRLDNIDCELINFTSESHANDGKNLHTAGMSYIEGGRTWFNFDDGISHHESCVGIVERHSSRYNGAGNYTPAFGARVYHNRCESVASDELSAKSYSGKMACVSGQSANTFAYYENCFSDQRDQPDAPYHADAQEVGYLAQITIINPTTRQYGGELCDITGVGDTEVRQS